MKVSNTVASKQSARDRLEREAAIFYLANKDVGTEQQPFRKASLRVLAKTQT